MIERGNEVWYEGKRIYGRKWKKKGSAMIGKGGKEWERRGLFQREESVSMRRVFEEEGEKCVTCQNKGGTLYLN